MIRRDKRPKAGLFRRIHLGPLLLVTAALVVLLVGTVSQRWGPVWYYRLTFVRPAGVVVHHSATAPVVGGRRVDAEFLDDVHSTRGWGLRFGDQVYHIGYHYVILPDGTVQPGRPDWMPGAHTTGHNDCLGICLIGDFSAHDGQAASPTEAQLRSLVDLLRSLIGKYHLQPEDVYRHSDLNATSCPGSGVPWKEIIRQLE